MSDVTTGIIRRLETLEHTLQRTGARDVLQVAIDPMMRLPGIRGIWPMAACDSSGNAQDCSGHGHHLGYNGNPVYDYDNLAPYIAFDGTGDYLNRADEADLDILGTESYVDGTAQGLTLGGWFYPTETATDEGLIGKYNIPGNNGYLIQKLSVAPDTVRMVVDNAGLVQSGVLYVTLNAWNHVVGKFAPSAELYVYVNGIQSDNGVGIPAAIGNNAIAFEISGYNNGISQLLTGYASLCFLCAAALSDTCIQSLFQQQRSLFGV